MKNKPVEIYALICPINGDVRYIGKANDSQKRLKSHIRDSRRRNTPVYCWIRKLTSQNLVPTIKVIAITTDEDWKAIEVKLILKHKKLGCNLLNVAEGGDEPFCSLEQRQKNGRTVANMIHSDPERKKIWALKKKMSDALCRFKRIGDLESYNKYAKSTRECAIKRPDLFGAFLKYQPL